MAYSGADEHRFSKADFPSMTIRASTHDVRRRRAFAAAVALALASGLSGCASMGLSGMSATAPAGFQLARNRRSFQFSWPRHDATIASVALATTRPSPTRTSRSSPSRFRRVTSRARSNSPRGARRTRASTSSSRSPRLSSLTLHATARHASFGPRRLQPRRPRFRAWLQHDAR